MSVDLQDLYPGPFDKFVYVMAQGQAVPYAVFELKGLLLPPIILSPTTLDFGNVPEGALRSSTITATFNPVMLTTESPPRLDSSTADIFVRQLVGLEARLAIAAARHPADQRTLQWPTVTRAYQITLSPKAPPGFLEESLTWTMPPAIVATVLVRAKVLRSGM